MIITRTPFRISFFGGGSDYPSHYQEHGGMVLGASIDKYCYLTVDYRPRFIKPRYRIVTSTVNECDTKDGISHPAVRATLDYMGIDAPMEILHASDLPSRSGVGSSSAFVVGLLMALYAGGEHNGGDPYPEGLAKAATRIEQDILNEPVGSQDQILTAHGGFNQIVWQPQGETAVRRLELPPERIQELEDHLMLFYTGARQGGYHHVRGVEHGTVEQLQRLAGMAESGINILTSGDNINGFGHLLDEAWRVKRELAINISTTQVDAMYQAARDAGASGGKLLGSGGGGFMLLFARPEFHARIKENLAHLIHVPFKFEFEGSKVIHA